MNVASLLSFTAFLLLVGSGDSLKKAMPKDSVQEALEHAQKGMYDKAKEFAIEAIEEDDEDPLPHQILSQIALVSGDKEQAYEHAVAAEKLAPQDSNYQAQRMFHEGLMEQEKGDFPKALSLFKSSVETLGENIDTKTLEKNAIAAASLGDIATTVKYLKMIWNRSPMYKFHNDIPFVRIAEAFEEEMELATNAGQEKEALVKLGNITSITNEVWFDVAIANNKPQRITIGLFGNAAPRAADNVLYMSRCDTGREDHCYKNTVFHRVIKDFIIQGGDVSPGDGTGRVNIYDRPYGDEVYGLALMHDGAGVVQMANSGPNSNGGQFVIMTNKAAHLNGAHVVVGKVLSGMDHVLKINKLKVQGEKFSPKKPVTIVDCGEVGQEKDEEAEAEA